MVQEELNYPKNNISHVESGNYSTNPKRSSRKNGLPGTAKHQDNSCFDKIRYFYNSSIVKFAYNVVFFGSFLFLLSTAYLNLFSDTLIDGVSILVYIVTLLIEEIIKVFSE